jgi:hypothetical protein
MLARAEKIEAARNGELSLDEELRDVVAAAEEAGLSRESVLLAVREQRARERPPEPGELVFAESVDGRHYAARVVAVAPGRVDVQFLKGSERCLEPAQVKRLELSPGSRAEVPWPGWGWWNSEVVSYNAEGLTVTATDGMSRHTFPLSEIRLKRPASASQERMRALGTNVAFLLAGTGLGLAIMRAILR